jgi:acetolactate synthase-1/2/3 large subunit
MKLTDALARILTINGIGHVFGLQGGAVVHIFDSLESLGVGVTYTHHEQSAALAAVAYAKATENIGCAVVTTGPGATNAITGLLAAWQDSIPCLFVSGQVRSQHTSYGRRVRQVGTQEVNICDIVRPISKYCKFIDDKDHFVEELQRALEIARSGRPGPVWLDLPLDYQWADIPFNESSVAKFQKPVVTIKDAQGAGASLKLLNNAERPLLILGYGLRLAGRSENLEILIKQLNIPFVTTWTGADLFPSAEPLNLGIIGMSGQRGANKAVFNSDLLICLGTHLSISQTTTLFDTYAPQSKKVIVNIDPNQLDNLNVKFDIKLNEDVNVYINWLLHQNINKFDWPDLGDFKNQNWYVPKASKLPNSNLYLRTLTELVTETSCLIVDGGGTALYTGFQSSVIKEKSRIICSSAISSMGTGLAETIGVAKTQAFSKLICIIGDGSFLMNVQDLQTIRQDNINVVISVINNNGYLAIRHTQKEFLGGRYFGCHPEWNLTMPSFEKIAAGFEIPYLRLDKAEDLDLVVRKLVATKGPVICEVVVDEEQDVLFKQGYKANSDGTFSPQPLSEMAPFL